MPIHETEDPAQPSALANVDQAFLVFYSSRDETGTLWCPDCRAVDGFVRGVFGPNDGPVALVIYVGQRTAWKDPTNPFRGEPYNVQSVPTIIRVRDVRAALRSLGISPLLIRPQCLTRALGFQRRRKLRHNWPRSSKHDRDTGAYLGQWEYRDNLEGA
ncbi:hypothetical protein DAEQUDRAFT_663535 [Daedalea quercina L-15889]|uniref:Thioredoxin domain-containing protein n=1 Tax=Daedalea quercina L-15889 TaxID=1314783 RepID=A0A165T3M8_9APHY|nr:hypothetical protein DAEQUDRAFT_663535 [Daedalea quercina L-15889]